MRPGYYADQVLDALQVSGPDDLKLLDEIAWERGAVVTSRPLDGAEARVAIVGRRAIITVSTRVTDPHRRRFNIAHELGHFEMHRYESRFALCTSKDIDDGEARVSLLAREQQANEFASSLLLPERFLKQPCEDNQPSMDFIRHIADTYDVSLTASARRFVEFSPEPCAVVFSKDGYIRWFLGSEEFRELGLFVDVKSKLDPSTQAMRCFNGLPSADRPAREKVSAWCREGRYRKDASLLDHSLAMPGYNAVLSLLWIDRDIDPDEDY